MKIAFVHCWLMPGGAKEVLQDLIANEEYAECKIFTMVSKYDFLISNNKEIAVKTVLPSSINKILIYLSENKIKILSSILDYRNLIIFSPIIMRRMSRQVKRYNPDKIVISSFAIAKNINNYDKYTKLYLHSPMQYIRTHDDEYARKIKGAKGLLRKVIKPILRKRDKRKRHYNLAISNSEYTARCAKEIYKLTSSVQYPKINENIFTASKDEARNDYFVFVGRTVKFVKELDLIIQSFNTTEEKLIIIGDGPDKQELMNMAGDNIIFMERMDDMEQIIDIISKSKGMINITKESFGKTTVISLGLGIPVLGYNDGASVELVDKSSGILLEEKNVANIVEAIKNRGDKNRNKEYISQKAYKTYKKHGWN